VDHILSDPAELPALLDELRDSRNRSPLSGLAS
jgi:hypothetical protein